MRARPLRLSLTRYPKDARKATLGPTRGETSTKGLIAALREAETAAAPGVTFGTGNYVPAWAVKSEIFRRVCSIGGKRRALYNAVRAYAISTQSSPNPREIPVLF